MEAKPRKWKILNSVIWALVFLIMCLFFAYLITKDQYLQFDNIAFFTFFLIPLIISINEILKIQRIKINAEDIIIFNILGKTSKIISRKHIKSFSIEDRQGKHEKLCVISECNTQYKIHSSSLSNYENIKQEIIKNIKEIVHKEEKDVTFKRLVFMSILSFCFVFLILHSHYKRIASINYDNYINVVFTIKGKPYTTGRYEDDMCFKINELPAYIFIFKRLGEQSFIKNISQNDTIIFKIKKEDYDTKITKNKALTLVDKHFKYRYIWAYEVEVENKCYLKLNDYINWQKRYKGGIVFWLLFIIASLFTIGFSTASIIKIRNGGR